MVDGSIGGQVSALAQALADVEARHGDNPKPSRGWPWPIVLAHCAQSIECSLDGFPKLKPTLIRATIGKLVARRFIKRGAFEHNLEGPIPGAPELDDTDPDEALTRLRKAITRFESHEGPLADHFIFGRLSKSDYAKIHAMHIADHLTVFQKP